MDFLLEFLGVRLGGLITNWSPIPVDFLILRRIPFGFGKHTDDFDVF